MFFILCILLFLSITFAPLTTTGGLVSCDSDEYLSGFCVGDGSSCEDSGAVTQTYCETGAKSWFSNTEYVAANMGSSNSLTLGCSPGKIMTAICSKNCEHDGQIFDYKIECKEVYEGVKWNKVCTKETPTTDKKWAKCSEMPIRACFSNSGECEGESYSLECCEEEYSKDLDVIYTFLGVLPPLFIAITLVFCVLNRHYAILTRAEKEEKNDNYVPSKQRKQNLTVSTTNLWSDVSMANMEHAMQLEMQMMASDVNDKNGPDMHRMGSRI